MIIDKFRSSGFIGNTFKLLTGNAIAQVIVLVTIPVLTRLYNPDSFGIFALFVTMSSIMHALSCFRYDAALIVPKNEKDSANLFSLGSILVLLFSSLILVMVVMLNDSLLIQLRINKLSTYILYLPFSIFLGGMFFMLNAWLIRRNNFINLSVSQILSSVTGRATAIIFALFNPSSFGLILSTIVGQIVLLLPMVYALLKNEITLFRSSINLKSMYKQALEYRSFSIYSVYLLFNSARRALPVFALGFLFDPFAVGFYALSQRVVGQPLGMISDAISRSFFQKASELYRMGHSLADRTKDLYRFLMTISFTPSVILAVTAQEVFEYVFGSDWTEAGLYYQVAWIFFLCPFLFRPLSIIFDVTVKQKQLFVFNVSLFFASIAAFWAGSLTGSPLLSMGAFTGINLVFYFYIIGWVLKYVGINYTEIIKIFIEHLGYALIFGVITWTGKAYFEFQTWKIVIWFFFIELLYFAIFFKKYKSRIVNL